MRPHGPTVLRNLALMWAGLRLILPPSNFERFAKAYEWAISLHIVEWHLGVLCLTAGTIGAIGAFPAMRWGRQLRLSGAVVGAAVWSALLVSFASMDPDLLSLGSIFLVAALCIRAILLEDPA